MNKTIQLGDYISTLKGFAFKSQWFEKEGHPIVKVSDFTENSIDTSKLVKIPFEVAEKYKKYALKTNDIVIQTVGSWPSNPASVVGKTIKVPCQAHGSLLNQNAVIIYPDKNIDQSYLYYVLKDQNFKDYIVGTAQGAASQASITLDAIKGFELELPDQEVQQKIASILSTYDDLIENNNRRIAILEEMARCLYREWFVKFRFPGHEAVKMIDSELGQIPEGWEINYLENVIDINRGRSYKSSELVDEGGMPFLNLKNIAREGGFRRDGLKGYDGPFKPTQTARANDIIMAVTDMTQERAVIARPARVPNMGFDTFVLSMDLIKITAKPTYDNGFIFCFLRYSQFSDEVKQFANGANVLHLSPSVIEKYQAVLPPIDLQEGFYAIVEKLHQLQDNLAIKNDNLKQQRNMLLPKLISGKIEVTI
jgi:type I restriction enzyme S subunit